HFSLLAQADRKTISYLPLVSYNGAMSLSSALRSFDPCRLLPPPGSVPAELPAILNAPPTPPPDPLEPVRRLLLESVSSPLTRAAYGQALDEFSAWRSEQGNPPFTRAAVNGWRSVLEQEGYAPSSINQKLAAVRKLAREAAANGLLDAEMAAGIKQVRGA